MFCSLYLESYSLHGALSDAGGILVGKPLGHLASTVAVYHSLKKQLRIMDLGIFLVPGFSMADLVLGFKSYAFIYVKV